MDPAALTRVIGQSLDRLPNPIATVGETASSGSMPTAPLQVEQQLHTPARWALSRTAL